MDIMHSQGWLRIRREEKGFTISCPELRFLEKAISSSNIRAPCHQSVGYGFHMYQCRVAEKSMGKLMSWLYKQMSPAETDTPHCSIPYARARMELFNGLSYPEYDNVSEQEYAAGASIHARKAGTWKCECGRYVLKDGLPCFCGQPAHYSQELKNGSR